LTGFYHAHSTDKHLSNGGVQFISTTMIAFKELRLLAMPRSWNGQIRKLAYRGFQIARVMAIALIAALLDSAHRVAHR